MPHDHKLLLGSSQINIFKLSSRIFSKSSSRHDHRSVPALQGVEQCIQQRIGDGNGG